MPNEYEVIITPSAEADIAEAFAYIYERSPDNAERWVRQLLKSIHALENCAGFGRARESDYLNVDLRQKVFKSHRIVFEVDDAAKQVIVHYVRHGARRPAGEEEEDPRADHH